MYNSLLTDYLDYKYKQHIKLIIGGCLLLLIFIIICTQHPFFHTCNIFHITSILYMVIGIYVVGSCIYFNTSTKRYSKKIVRQFFEKMVNNINEYLDQNENIINKLYTKEIDIFRPIKCARDMLRCCINYLYNKDNMYVIYLLCVAYKIPQIINIIETKTTTLFELEDGTSNEKITENIFDILETEVTIVNNLLF